jgi:ComF family protein
MFFNKIISLTDDLIWMMYPSLCAACSRPLFSGEECICSPCRYHLPRTNFHKTIENPVIKSFWGKADVRHATAYYHFSKGERVQKLIHQLKYKGRKDVGEFVGRMMGTELRSSVFNEVEIIVPVPLHKSRLKHRGYNQSDCFAEGLASGLNKISLPGGLERNEATATQTKKHRFERFKNVNNIFIAPDELILKNKKILLVDDVITTGSTLISCAEALLKIPGAKVFVAAIACA